MDLPEGSFSHSPLHPEDVEVGKYTAIADGCIFHGSDNHISAIDPKVVANNLDTTGHSKGKIIIGNDVWIGQGVRVLSGACIGDGAIIGAGAVVSGMVEPYAIEVGNPNRVAKFRFGNKQIAALLKIAWWDWPEEKISQAKAGGDFNDIEQFILKYGT